MKRQFKNEKFSDLTTEDLIRRKKAITFATGLLIGALISLFAISVFQTINKGITPLLAVPFALLPLLIIIYSQVSSIDKEIKSRKSNV